MEVTGMKDNNKIQKNMRMILLRKKAMCIWIRTLFFHFCTFALTSLIASGESGWCFLGPTPKRYMFACSRFKIRPKHPLKQWLHREQQDVDFLYFVNVFWKWGRTGRRKREEKERGEWVSHVQQQQQLNNYNDNNWNNWKQLKLVPPLLPAPQLMYLSNFQTIRIGLVTWFSFFLFSFIDPSHMFDQFSFTTCRWKICALFTRLFFRWPTAKPSGFTIYDSIV